MERGPGRNNKDDITLILYLKSDNIETVSDGHNDVSLDGVRGVLPEVQLVDEGSNPTADLKHLGLKSKQEQIVLKPTQNHTNLTDID